MNRKFQHEHHNRQEKVWKEPTRCVGGKESPSLFSHVTSDGQIRRVINRQVSDSGRRQDLMEYFETMIRPWQFIVSGYKFRLTWSVRGFANANGLSLPKAKIVFDKVRADAEGRLRMVKQRMRRTGFHTGYEQDETGNVVKCLYLSYAELPKFLQRDEGVKSLQATRDGGSSSASRFTSLGPARLSSGC
jgi:hypothetical protein